MITILRKLFDKTMLYSNPISQLIIQPKNGPIIIISNFHGLSLELDEQRYQQWPMSSILVEVLC